MQHSESLQEKSSLGTIKIRMTPRVSHVATVLSVSQKYLSSYDSVTYLKTNPRYFDLSYTCMQMLFPGLIHKSLGSRIKPIWLQGGQEGGEDRKRLDGGLKRNCSEGTPSPAEGRQGLGKALLLIIACVLNGHD